jgi:hypothetical protein
MIHPRAPSTLVITDFTDERNRFDHYWDRLRACDVPTPETLLLDIVGDEWDTNAIVAWMEGHGFDRAFVRSQHKSATRRFSEGSYIPRTDPESIDRTVRSLLGQNVQDGWPTGDGLVVREWLDLDFCPFPAHDTCRPEVRYFIEGGEIIGEVPSIDDATFVCPGRYDHLDDVLADLDPEVPRSLAGRVATAFTEDSWAVDFVMDTRGDWYCVEMNFNGVRWADELDDWANMCGHGDHEPWSPREVHSAALWGLRPLGR